MVELRTAELPDYIAIAKIHSKSWQENYRDILSNQFLDNEVEKDHLELWQKRLASSMADQQVTLAVVNENIVGFSCLLLNYDSLYGSLLDNLHVLREFQNSGIGKMLMKNCAKMILENGVDRKMHLWVYEANQKARKVYKHLGGTYVHSVTKSNVDGTKANACRYLWNDVASFFLVITLK